MTMTMTMPKNKIQNRSLSLSGLWLASQFKANNGELHFWTPHPDPMIVSKSYHQVGPVQVGSLAQAQKPCCWLGFGSLRFLKLFEREKNGAKMMRYR